MGFLMNRSTGVVLLLTFFMLSCNKLRIKEFPAENEPMVQPMLTLQQNYQRNAVTDEELAPPLVLEWEENLPVLRYGFQG